MQVGIVLNWGLGGIANLYKINLETLNKTLKTQIKNQNTSLDSNDFN